eukprot:Hpha_TRINITY_DN179_c0_g1::TRINITY_DN179_c0_g1_i1::g.82437::m.82437
MSGDASNENVPPMEAGSLVQFTSLPDRLTGVIVGRGDVEGLVCVRVLQQTVMVLPECFEKPTEGPFSFMPLTSPDEPPVTRALLGSQGLGIMRSPPKTPAQDLQDRVDPNEVSQIESMPARLSHPAQGPGDLWTPPGSPMNRRKSLDDTPPLYSRIAFEPDGDDPARKRRPSFELIALEAPGPEALERSGAPNHPNKSVIEVLTPEQNCSGAPALTTPLHINRTPGFEDPGSPTYGSPASQMTAPVSQATVPTSQQTGPASRRDSGDTEPASQRASPGQGGMPSWSWEATGTQDDADYADVDETDSPDACTRSPLNHRISRITTLRRRIAIPADLQLSLDVRSTRGQSPTPAASEGRAGSPSYGSPWHGSRGWSMSPQLGTGPSSFFSSPGTKPRSIASLGLLGEKGRRWLEPREVMASPYSPGFQAGPYKTIFDPQTGMELALWEIHSGGDRASAVSRDLCQLSSVNHPNVLRVCGADIRAITSLLFTEVPGKSLRDLTMRYALGTELLRKYATQVLRGLAHLQSKGFVHGRLDQDHICVTARGVAQVCMWGVTEIVFPGSPTKKDDVWSLGLVIRELNGPSDLVAMLLTPGRRADEVLREQQQSPGFFPTRSSASASNQGSPSGFRQWRRVGVLGHGSFGQVFKVVGPRGEGPMAMKLLQFNDAEEATAAFEEIQTHQELEHANIVRYGGFRVEGGQLFIYMELMMGGTLARLLKMVGPLQDCLVARYMRQILSAIDYIHSRAAPILHRDLKGLNVLLTEDLAQAKISDFGAAKVQVSPKGGGAITVGGTVLWMAPEVFCGVVTTSADIWASGCVMCEMLTGGHTPWPREWHLHEAIFRIGQWKPESDDALPPAVPTTCSEGALDLLQKCFKLEVSQRPTAGALLRHHFIAKVQTRAEDFALETLRERLRTG